MSAERSEEAGPTGPASPVLSDRPARRRLQLQRAGELAQRSTRLRDELILAAIGQGMSQREVARLVGLTHTAVQYIARRATDRA